jgi:hypothetical protein
MIRRDAGSDWLLISQHDHAAVAARLAGHVGGRRFAAIQARRASVLAAIAAHDDGWAAHDAAPTLDAAGRPLDTLDAPYPVALPAWAAATPAVASTAGPWAGLLVSLHALSLSIHAAGGQSPGHAAFQLSGAHATFAVNQFQHREIERQESLRAAVGLPSDIPLTHGLAEPGVSPDDDQLAYGFRLLQAMDLISLCLCATRPPVSETGEVMPAPGASPKRLSVARDLSGALRVKPWPFDAAMIELTVPCRRMPARPFETVEALRAATAAAAVERLTVTLRG